MDAGDEAQNIVDISNHVWCSWRLGFLVGVTSLWPGWVGSSLESLDDAVGVSVNAALALEGRDQKAE